MPSSLTRSFSFFKKFIWSICLEVNFYVFFLTTFTARGGVCSTGTGVGSFGSYSSMAGVIKPIVFRLAEIEGMCFGILSDVKSRGVLILSFFLYGLYWLSFSIMLIGILFSPKSNAVDAIGDFTIGISGSSGDLPMHFLLQFSQMCELWPFFKIISSYMSSSILDCLRFSSSSCVCNLFYIPCTTGCC